MDFLPKINKRICTLNHAEFSGIHSVNLDHFKKYESIYMRAFNGLLFESLNCHKYLKNTPVCTSSAIFENENPKTISFWLRSSPRSPLVQELGKNPRFSGEPQTWHWKIEPPFSTLQKTDSWDKFNWNTSRIVCFQNVSKLYSLWPVPTLLRVL